MMTIDKSLAQAIEADYRPGLLAEIVTVWREFILAAFDSYHPERHYMRGPGPACRKKQSG